MPKPIPKNLNFCFFAKIKRPSHHSDHLVRPFFSNPFLKTFNSLYDLTFDRTNSKSSALSAVSDDLNSSDSNSDAITGSTPDFATIFASHRFFFSSPGRSNSIVDSSSASISSGPSSSSSPAAPPEPENILVDRSVAVPTYSPDPLLDFRRSMQEMVEARELIDWDFLQELLMCYLALNPKSAHKFILGAFADLLVSLVISSPVSECRRSNFSDEGDQ